MGNELNERLIATRCTASVTWLLALVALEGFGWKDAARWCPRSSSPSVMLAAQFNPFLQFAVGAGIWMLALLIQLALQRLASIRLGHDLNDFVDFCSVANVSVLFMDEPFHGFYIHGKAPSSRGDWSHTELAKVLHDEAKGIGFNRGLAPDGCQTFEMFLPPDMAVQTFGGVTAHFRQTLCRIYSDVQATQNLMLSRLPEKPTLSDVAQMSYHRCSVQALIDAMVHAVMRGTSDVVQVRRSLDWFWGAPPPGGVTALRHPIFYKDQDGLSWPNGLAWSSCLAYGAEFRVAGLGFPTGFEWHLGLLEVITFSLIWRFQGSVLLGALVAFVLNQLVLRIYGVAGRRRLARTAIINDVFLL